MDIAPPICIFISGSISTNTNARKLFISLSSLPFSPRGGVFHVVSCYSRAVPCCAVLCRPVPSPRHGPGGISLALCLSICQSLILLLLLRNNQDAKHPQEFCLKLPGKSKLKKARSKIHNQRPEKKRRRKEEKKARQPHTRQRSRILLTPRRRRTLTVP